MLKLKSKKKRETIVPKEKEMEEEGGSPLKTKPIFSLTRPDKVIFANQFCWFEASNCHFYFVTCAQYLLFLEI